MSEKKDLEAYDSLVKLKNSGITFDLGQLVEDDIEMLVGIRGLQQIIYVESPLPLTFNYDENRFFEEEGVGISSVAERENVTQIDLYDHSTTYLFRTQQVFLEQSTKEPYKSIVEEMHFMRMPYEEIYRKMFCKEPKT